MEQGGRKQGGSREGEQGKYMYLEHDSSEVTRYVSWNELVKWAGREGAGRIP